MAKVVESILEKFLLAVVFETVVLILLKQN